MAESTRRTAAELVDKPMGEEHGDVARESVAWLCLELIEAEVSAQIGADHGEVSRRPRHPAQRLPPEELRNARRRDRARHPQGADGERPITAWVWSPRTPGARPTPSTSGSTGRTWRASGLEVGRGRRNEAPARPVTRGGLVYG